MATEYLGKTNGITTIEELLGLVNIPSTNLTFTGDATFLNFKNGNNHIFVCDRVCRNIDWNKLNTEGLIAGKEISIGDKKYTCRLLTGGDSNPSTAAGGEWDSLIVKFVPANTDSYWSDSYTWCKETASNNASNAIIRGGSQANGYTSGSKSTNYGIRLVLELKCKLNNSISSQDLGDITSWLNKAYIITGDTFTLTEKLDGVILRTLSNQVSGTQYTLDLSTQWDSLSYGKHSVEIITVDSNGLSNTVTITFTKIKAPIQKLPSDATLVQRANYTKEMNDEIEYQMSKLKSNLASKGLDVTNISSMSGLISSINRITHIDVPNWVTENGLMLTTGVIESLGTKDFSMENVNNITYLVGMGSGNRDVIYYDFETNIFTRIASSILSVSKSGAPTSVVGDTVYVMCGSSVQSVDKINTVTKTVTTTPNIFGSAWAARTKAASNGPNIYIFGGYNSRAGSWSTAVECYNTVTDTVSTKKCNVPHMTQTYPSFNYNGKLYYLEYKNLHEYNETTDTLTKVDTLNALTGIPYNTTIHKGFVYISAVDGIYKYSIEKKECHKIRTFSPTSIAECTSNDKCILFANNITSGTANRTLDVMVIK